MKSQTAAEAVAAARWRAQGWRPPRGELKSSRVVDEETGGARRAVADEERPTWRASTACSTRAAAR
jgi:acetylornithine deacetylase/succinyl-diaminopimelate desuccinylase-like protein